MPLLKRLLAASSFTCLALAGFLLYLVYQDRDSGVTLWNILRCLGAGALVFLSVQGTKLRHASRPPQLP